MKKVISLLLILVLCLSVPMAFAESIIEWDLLALPSGNSTNTSEWWVAGVVPPGVYIIGEDIPAGTWMFQPMPASRSIVSIGNKLRNSNKDVDPMSFGFQFAFLVAEDFAAKEQISSEQSTSVVFSLDDVLYLSVQGDDVIISCPLANFD